MMLLSMLTSTRFGVVLPFATLVMLFAALLGWQLNHNYSADEAVYNWVVIRALFDGGALPVENLGVDLLYGQLALLSPFYITPFLLPLSQYLVSIIAVSALLVIWNRDLTIVGYSRFDRLLLLILVLANPALLWCATGGYICAVSLMILYLLHRAILRVIYEGSIRAYIAVGLLMALYVQFDATAYYVLAVLLPLMVVFIPLKHRKISPHSTYIIIGLPLVVMVVSWLYFNWVFHERALAFLSNPYSVFHGAKLRAEEISWLYAYGGQFLQPFAIGLAYIAIGYPGLLILLWYNHKQPRSLQAAIAIFLYPALAIGVATLTYYLTTPLQIIALLNAIVMAEIVRYRGSPSHPVTPLVLCLVLGVVANWYLIDIDSTPQVKAWSASLMSTQGRADEGERKLGEWLALHREATLLDLRSGYKAVATRGDAHNLITPFSDEYRLAVQRDNPAVPQIVISNPDGRVGRIDELNKIFPELYGSGMPGYKLVYDEDGWRVYRKS